MNKDINVTPNLEPTTNLGPFKFFALTNFPYIEQTFDTLTNYELMCKIAEELNKFIKNNNATNQNVINLYNAFVSLQKYVNDYFDDLNVQNEVNTKLDQMASDGTLATIINENIFNELNTDLENLTNKVGSETLPVPDSSVSKNVVDLSNKVNVINDDLNNLLLDDIVVFGDSWTDSSISGNNWPNIVSSFLSLTLHNYAKSGALVNGTASKDLVNQITSAKSDDTLIADKVKYVIVLMGINDYDTFSDQDQLVDKLKIYLQEIEEYFTNATVYYVSNCRIPLTVEQSSFWRYIHQNINNPSLNLDTYFNRDYMNSTLFHLNVAGQELLAKNIIALILGGNFVKCNYFEEFENEQASVMYSIFKDDSQVEVNLAIRPKQSLNQYNVDPPKGFGSIDYGPNAPTNAIIHFPGYQQVACVIGKGVACSSSEALTVNQIYLFKFTRYY